MKRLCGVHHNQLVLLLVAAVATALDPAHNLANERTSIERTYELTKYLEYQLKEIKDTYLSYLGPPFNEKDFSPPRPNTTALSLPSAATRLELWRGLENRARLAQNQRAYSVLLAAVRELARSTLCPYLQTSLLHFCTGLDGLLGSISGLMTTLGYALPPPSAVSVGGSDGELQEPRRDAGGDGGRGGGGGSRPAPLMSQSLYKARAGTRPVSGQRDSQRRGGSRVVRGGREDGVRRDAAEKWRGKEGRRAEAGGGSKEKGKGERRRRGKRGEPESARWATGEEERFGEEEEELESEGGAQRWGRRRLLSQQHRSPRSLLSPTLHPPLSTLSLLYPFGVGEEHTLLPQPVEGFWILRELQSWLWRSAKDFNRLKKRLRG
ncbi:uncharacterized protein clcf1 [Myripristis murdjan]|uniref:uncharacterized protein clcf1 n=1 Tax=Myripristis murdjan TaxID=586833 RepID=UPI001175F142|nr:cardiotrophin-like cytokine factor 1 [Myripristis murdjan]